MSEQPTPQIEAWLRGPIAGVHPITLPFLFSMQQVREDLAHWTEGLTVEQLWARPHGLGAVGFHARHIGGSTERLATYLKGESLTEEQFAAMRAEEKAPGIPRDELLRKVEDQLLFAEAVVKSLDPRTWPDPRTIGRKAFPTTVGGLVHHIAEHAQRHVGEVIVTAKIVRAGT